MRSLLRALPGAALCCALPAVLAGAVSPLDFGAAGNGSTDVAGALNSAVAAAQNGAPNAIVVIPAGQYLLDGSGGTIDLTHVTLRCEGAPADADAATGGTGAGTIGRQGATFRLTSKSVQPFAFGPGVRIEGCNFYWPNQKAAGTSIAVGASPFTYANSTSEPMEVAVSGGTVSRIAVNGVTQPYTRGTFNVPERQSIVVTYTAAPAMASWEPIVYPPLFTEIAGSQATNIDLINDRIINAYDVWDQTSAGDSQGSIQLSGTYGYAIHDWFHWALNQNTATINGLLADPSLAQDLDPAPYYFMREWTAHNGAIWDIWGNASSMAAGGVGAIEMANSGVYEYRYFIHVNSGGLISESNFTGNTIDGVGADIEVDAGGCLSGTRLTGDWYAYIPDNANGLWNPKAIDANPAFSLNSVRGQGCTTTAVEIDGILEQAQGDVLDVSGPFVKTVTLSLPSSGAYGRANLAGPFYFVDSASSATNLILDVHDTHIEPQSSQRGSGRRGIRLSGAYQATLDGNTFNSVYDPIILDGTAAGRVTGAGNVSTASPAGSVGVAGTDFTDIHALQDPAGNHWDILPAPAVSACGTRPAIFGNDSKGEIGVGRGTVSACSLTFATPFAGTPVCQATNTLAPLIIAALSTKGITFSAYRGAPIGGSQIYYSCRP